MIHRRALAGLVSALWVAVPPAFAAGTPTPADRGRTLLFLSADDSAALEGHALVEATQIHLSDLGFRVEPRVAALTGSLGEQLRFVLALLEETGAPLAFWHTVEAGAEGPDVVLYVVSPRGAHALVSIVRVAATPDSSTYRTLALKIRELVRRLLLATDSDLATSPASVRSASLPATLPAAGVGVTAAEKRALPLVSFGVGYALSVVGGDLPPRHGGRARLGVRLIGPLDAHVGAGILGAVVRNGSSGVASLRGIPVEVGSRLMIRATGWLSLGLSLDLILHVVDVRAAELRGGEGRAVRLVPGVGLEGQVRIRLLDRVALLVGLAFEVLLVHQRFTLRGEQVFDLGRVGFRGTIGLEIPVF